MYIKTEYKDNNIIQIKLRQSLIHKAHLFLDFKARNGAAPVAITTSNHKFPLEGL